MALKIKSATTVHLQKSKKDDPESLPVVSKVKDYIGIAVGIANIIKICKDLFASP